MLDEEFQQTLQRLKTLASREDYETIKAVYEANFYLAELLREKKLELAGLQEMFRERARQADGIDHQHAADWATARRHRRRRLQRRLAASKRR